MQPLLEQGSGLPAGPDFHLGYSPERIDPGNPTWTFENTPKVVSGIDAASLAAVTALYDRLVERTVPGQLAPRGRAHQAAGEHVPPRQHRPGQRAGHVRQRPGHRRVGGHRRGVDQAVRLPALHPGPGRRRPLPADRPVLPVVAGAPVAGGRRSASSSWPTTSTTTCPTTWCAASSPALNRRRLPVNGQRILLLGLAYKRNTGDARETPSRPIAEQLLELGAEVLAADPHVRDDLVPDGVHAGRAHRRGGRLVRGGRRAGRPRRLRPRRS